MQSAPPRIVNPEPHSTRPATTRRLIKRGLRPATIIVAALIALGTLGIMAVTLLGIWPPRSAPPPPAQSVTQTSPYAKMLQIEKNGPPRKDSKTGQWIIPLKAINKVEQPYAVNGTPTPGITPVPKPVNVLAASVKVLLYTGGEGSDRRYVGTAYGGFSTPKGLAPDATEEFEVPAATAENVNITDYEAFTDLLSTDQDPITQREAEALEPTSPVASPTSIPLGTATVSIP